MLRRVFSKKIFFVPLIILFMVTPSFSQNYNDLDELEELINRLMQEQEEQNQQQPEMQTPQSQQPAQTQPIPQDTDEVIIIEETDETEPLIEPEEPAQPEQPEPQLQPQEPQIQPQPQPEPEPQPQVQPQSEQQTEQESQTEAPAESEEETRQYEALALIRYKNSDTISFKFKVSYIPKPYILGLSLAAGYTEYKMLQPFYFGGYLEPHLGIPQKDFPFKYEQDGSAISGPLIIGGKLYAPFGICVFPFQQNIEVFVEFEPGITLDMLWNTKFGKKAITSKLYPAFYAAIRTGATYKGFTAFVEGNYDAVLGFGVSIGIGYSFNVNFERQASQTDLPDLAE